VYQGEKLLQNKAVFLSASKPSRDLKLFPAIGESVIEEAVRCFARAVFAEDGHLVFGAHPSISPLIVDVATEYFEPVWTDRSEDSTPVTIYQSEAFEDVIPPATRDLERLGYARIIFTEQQNNEKYSPDPPPREQCLASLAHMRQRMFKEQQPVAMVGIGGMQGILREARLFLEMFTSGNVYVMTSSQGAAGRLVPYLSENILQERRPIAVQHWQTRVIPVEQQFAVQNWQTLRASRPEIPEQPYALLMQDVVRHIAGEEPT
jgi:SLOG cluster3 family